MSSKTKILLALALLLMGVFGYSFFVYTTEEHTMTYDEVAVSAPNIVLDFYADWCGPCKQMDRIVWPDKRVQAELKYYRQPAPQKIDVDLYPAFAKKWRVSLLPTIIITNSNGKELSRIVGYRNAIVMQRWLKKYRDKK